MTVEFSADGLWRAIRQVGKDRGPRYVAVPYVGSRGPRRLSLRRGDVLVTRFDDATIRSGGVDPKAIERYLRRGVKVFRADQLHAKVYVSAERAVVGSANLSESSALRLVEAGIVVRRSALVSEARRFVRSLAASSSFIGPELAKEKQKIYRPPRARGASRMRREDKWIGPRFWLVHLKYIDFAPETAAAAERARRKVKRRRDKSLYNLEDVELNVRGRKVEIKRGDEILQIMRDGRRTSLQPLAVIAATERFRSKGGVPKILIVVESRKWLHDRSLSSVRSRIGDGVYRRLRRVAGPTECRDFELIERVRQLWRD